MRPTRTPLTVLGVAHVLGISVATVNDLVSDGKLKILTRVPASHGGTKVRLFHTGEVEALRAARIRHPPSNVRKPRGRL